MSILGIGIDIEENKRFEDLLQKGEEGLFQRVFTEEEKTYCDKYKRVKVRAQHYTARFAAKEALVKALGTGFRNLNFKDMEVKKGSLGAPYFSVKGSVAELLKKMGVEKVHLSISHSDNYSVALVIVEGKGGEDLCK